MTTIQWTSIIICLFLCGSALAKPTENTNDLTNEVAELRQDLALTRLQLHKAMNELKQLQEYLKQNDKDQQFKHWQQEKRTLEESRLRLKRERHHLQTDRKLASHQQSKKKVEAQTKKEQAKDKAIQADKPNWSVQYMLGLIDKYHHTYYSSVQDGRFTLDNSYTEIDWHQVKAKGTFLNESRKAWRYTFEIRLGTNAGLKKNAFMSQWRVQTPLLQPGDMHEFEVEIPVKNVFSIDTVQIGNIVADRPGTKPITPEKNKTRISHVKLRQ